MEKRLKQWERPESRVRGSAQEVQSMESNTAVGFALEKTCQAALTPEIKEKDDSNGHQSRGH